jgi:hypothetical protein
MHLLLAAPLFWANLAWAIRVYNFDASRELALNNPLSFATLSNSPENELPDRFILCTSHKQNMLDDTSYFHMFGEDRQPWFSMVFLEQGSSVQLWTNLDKTGISHMVGVTVEPKIKVWYHICAGIDIAKATITIAINGEKLAKEVNTSNGFNENKPRSVQNKLIIGAWWDTWGTNEKQQFYGAVSNIRIFPMDDLNDIQSLSRAPCAEAKGHYMRWEDMTWEMTGENIRETDSQWSACNEHLTKKAWLAIPMGLAQRDAVDLCTIMGDGKMTMANNQLELSGFLEWYNKTTTASCYAIWTPFSDKEEEGSFKSCVDGSALEYEPWLDGQPNGGRVQNSIAIKATNGREATPYIDVDGKKRRFCSACDIKLGLGFELRGVCESTILGE